MQKNNLVPSDGAPEMAALLDEMSEQDYAAVSGACSTNTFTLSNRYGNKGGWCTITVECMAWC